MHKPYLLASKKVSHRVRRQLLEAMIFEGLIAYEELVQPEESESLFYLIGTERNYRCKGKRMAFDRIRIKEDSIFQELPDHTLLEVTIEELLEELTLDCDDKGCLLNELSQTIKLCEWNEMHQIQPLSRRESSYEELESEIIEGHPYHPCFKSRTGFTVEDHEMYGPEAKQSFILKWFAVRRSKVRISLFETELDFWKGELGQAGWDQLLAQLESMKGSFEEYTFLPVHPWQWKSIQHLVSNCLEVGDILPLHVDGDRYRATQSVRTLWNESYPEKAYIKLPMNMVNTSSLRKLETHSVCAAPYISAWIETIIQSDSYLQKTEALIVLKEYAGVTFETEDEKISELDGQLGAIWRESVRKYIKEDEGAVPFTALLMMESDGFPFIDSWLKQYGTERWVKRLIEVSVVPVWHLLVAHGIAIEAHAQNMILLHKNGWPIRVVLRDFHESVEFTEEYLAEGSLAPNFEKIHKRYKDAPADQYYWMSSIEALRELLMDTLFVFHLSELSFLLEEQFRYKEEYFWSQVETSISIHLHQYPILKNRHKQLHLSSAQIYVESLLTRKIQHKEEGDFHHLVRNVFSNNKLER